MAIYDKENTKEYRRIAAFLSSVIVFRKTYMIYVNEENAKNHVKHQDLSKLE